MHLSPVVSSDHNHVGSKNSGTRMAVGLHEHKLKARGHVLEGGASVGVSKQRFE